MQKVKTVKRISFLVMIVFALVSCQQEQQSDDQQLLELVLQEKQNQFNKPIYLNPIGENKNVKDFFRLRNSDNKTFRFANFNNTDKKIAHDSSFVKYDTIIYENLKITQNNYITWGKGIDKKTEDFLKDSFNYKQVRIIDWKLPKTLKNIYLEKKDSEQYKKIRVSTPVYNLDKNKAILFTLEQSHKSTSTQNIYFIKKRKNVWNIIYTEKLDWFLD